jgi:hypothetical protein
MTGTNCDFFTHHQSRLYLNQFVRFSERRTKIQVKEGGEVWLEFSVIKARETKVKPCEDKKRKPGEQTEGSNYVLNDDVLTRHSGRNRDECNGAALDELL